MYYYNVVEGINPPQKIHILQEAIRHIDQYVAELWKGREYFSTQEAVQEIKSGIEDRQEQEPIAGFRQYHEEFEQYTCERIWGNIRNAMGYTLNPKGAIVGQWHFPYISQRLHEFTRKSDS